MKVRGTRECKNCGTQWSYYETGSVSCPTCGSMQSVGLEDDRIQHTDTPATLELGEAREAVDSKSVREVATMAANSGRDYVKKRGFIKGGELQPLDDTYLSAQELRHVADEFSRALKTTDDEEMYFFSLLRGADVGERPAPADVPKSLREVRGLADAESLREYHKEMGEWVREHDVNREGRDTLETLGEHVRRARALEGAIDIETASALVSSARDLARYFREDDEDALVSVRATLDRIE